jgi:hypothetical protein
MGKEERTHLDQQNCPRRMKQQRARVNPTHVRAHMVQDCAVGQAEARGGGEVHGATVQGSGERGAREDAGYHYAEEELRRCVNT